MRASVRINSANDEGLSRRRKETESFPRPLNTSIDVYFVSQYYQIKNFFLKVDFLLICRRTDISQCFQGVVFIVFCNEFGKVFTLQTLRTVFFGKCIANLFGLQMIRALGAGSSNLGSNRGHSVLFLAKTIYSHSASLHQVVLMGADECNTEGNHAMDQHPFQNGVDYPQRWPNDHSARTQTYYDLKLWMSLKPPRSLMVIVFYTFWLKKGAQGY